MRYPSSALRVGRVLAIVALCGPQAGCRREPAADVTHEATRGADHESTAPKDSRFRLVAIGEPPWHRFEFTGLDADELAAFAQLNPYEQSQVLDVRTLADAIDANLANPPHVAGKASIEDQALCFTPRFALDPDVRYLVIVDRGRLSDNAAHAGDAPSAIFRVERKPAVPTTTIERIYPTADRLPENQLKFYLHFSAPMSRGEAYRHIHLLDEDGKEVEDAFLELGEELWDRDFQRFTLLFDPGRVKRGLKPREELGPVIREGSRYTLVVDDAWRDAGRVPLAAGARKTFSVGPPDEQPIDPAEWKIEAPRAGSAEPLVVRFGEPLDQALAERVLRVADASGQRVAGTSAVTDGETSWQFTPEESWAEGDYQLLAESTLEDLAGNAIGRPFEVDEFGPVSRRIETQTVSVPFSVKP